MVVITVEPTQPPRQTTGVAAHVWLPPATLNELTAVGIEAANTAASNGETAVFAVYEDVTARLQQLEAAVDAAAPHTTPGEDDAAHDDDDLPERSQDSFEPAAYSPSSDRIGVSLRFLLRFCIENEIAGFDKFAEVQKFRHSSPPPTTGNVCFAHVHPATKDSKTTYTALPEPYIRPSEMTEPPTHFVSHSWGCPFASLVTACAVHQLGHDAAWQLVEKHVDLTAMATALDTALEGGEPENFYWVDIFAKNQHVIESESTAFELAQTVQCIAGGIVLVLHPLTEPRMLQRVWCLFEMHQAIAYGLPLVGLPSFDGMMLLHEIFMKERHSPDRGTGKARGSRSDRRQTKSDMKAKVTSGCEGGRSAGAVRSTLAACDVLRKAAVNQINVKAAKATVAADRTMILTEIERELGVDKMTQQARENFNDCMARCQAAALDSWALLRNDSTGRYRAAAASVLATSPLK